MRDFLVCVNKVKLVIPLFLFLSFGIMSTLSFASDRLPERGISNKSISVFMLSGIIYNDKEQPLAGVSVMVLNSSAGAITDEAGRFSINVNIGDVLEVSAIGYKTQKIKVTSTSDVRINMESDVAGLEDIVVVGYGRQKVITRTGAVSAITGSEIRRTPNPNIQNVLSGQLPGYFSVQRSGRPGGDAADFFIRGISTFADNNQRPLIMVDDLEYTYERFSSIDPNEVENITILKDAGTTAIYGIKGANGVILVTTRRGKTGRPVINFKTQTGAQVPVKPMQFLDAYNAALLRNEALKNDGLSPQFSDADLELFKNGQDPYRHPNVDWYKTLLRKFSLMTTNNIDVSGGTDKVKYFTSVGYLWQNGNLKDFKPPSIYQDDNINSNFYFKRYNFRSNLDVNATRSLTLKLDLNGNYEERNAPTAGANVYYDMAHYEQLPPFAYNVYNPDGSYGFSDGQLVPQPAEGNANNIVGRMAMGGYRREFGNQIIINANAIQKLDDIIRGLSARGTVAFTSSNNSVRSLNRGNEFPAFAYNPETGVYTPRDINVFRVAPLGLGYGGGTPLRRLTIQGALNYNRSFGQHNLAMLLLYNQNSEYTSSNNRNFDYVPTKLVGITYRASYNYKQKYMLEVSGANNGTNRFITQKRYGFFPAISAGYNISEEPFFKNLFPFVNMLKIRGSWGITGDDATPAGSRYIYEEIYNRYGGAAYFGETPNTFSGIREGTLGNDNVTWQKERKSDFAVEFSMFKGKLAGSVSFFDNFRYDILRARQTVPFYFGVTAVPPVNLGKVSNKGYEIEITHRGDIGSELKYNMRLVYSYAKNKILEMDEPPALYPWMRQTGTSIGTARMFIWDGFYTAEEIADPKVAKPSGVILPGFLKYRDLNEDGVINDFDRAYMGNPNVPNSNAGFNFGFSYKGISINVLFQGAWDYNFNVGWRLATPFKANLQPLHQKRWTPETAATAEFPTLTSNFNGSYMSPTSNQVSTFWSINSQYLRLRSIELGYDLPRDMVSKIGMSGVRVFASGFNLYTWSNTFKKYQYDPETSRDVESSVYPQQRIVNLGLSFTFK